MRADHCQPERKPLALEANPTSNNSFNKHNIPTNQLIANSLNNQTGQTNLKQQPQQQSPFSSFSSRELSANQSSKTKNSTAESVLLNAFKQQQLINSTNKKQQEALAAVLLDANNNRISNVNNVTNSSTSLSNTAAAALNLTPIDQSVKNSNLSNNGQAKCTSPSADLNTLASVVNNLFGLNNQESDSNNNSIACKNQNDLLVVGKQKAGEFLDNNNNNSELHSPLTSAGLLAAAANLSDLNSVLLQQQDCNNNNKLLNDDSPNQSNLGTITKAFDLMAKMASGNSTNSTLNNACKNLLESQVDADGNGSNMEIEEQNAHQTEIDLNVNQILDEDQFHFRLTPPHSNSNSSSFPNLQYICEYSSRLLFLSVQWAQKITVFKKFTDQTQIQLLKSCWCDLFILGNDRANHCVVSRNCPINLLFSSFFFKFH